MCETQTSNGAQVMCVQQESHAYIQSFMVQALSWARGCIPTLNVHVLWRADTFPTMHGGVL